ncbi:unnamed protein product [Meganyctiphanes norvegica]|uniref:Uncharacterized protein n=1 Tax=Meganyctiphanes norvegica TaxID=48144 RepID=A0AAV2SPP4_MEGNR
MPMPTLQEEREDELQEAAMATEVEEVLQGPSLWVVEMPHPSPQEVGQEKAPMVSQERLAYQRHMQKEEALPGPRQFGEVPLLKLMEAVLTLHLLEETQLQLPMDSLHLLEEMHLELMIDSGCLKHHWHT